MGALRGGAALSPVERVLYGGSTLRRWARTFARSRNRRVLGRGLLRGAAAGLLTSPRPTAEVLASAGSGLRRLIVPYEYRHLRFFGTGRIAGGLVATTAGVICLAYSAYGWAAFFLIIGVLNLAGGSWFLSIDGSASPRT